MTSLFLCESSLNMHFLFTGFENCAVLHGGGWWYRACADTNLNGNYITEEGMNNCRESCFGITWGTWHNEPRYSLKASMMLIRPMSPE